MQFNSTFYRIIALLSKLYLLCSLIQPVIKFNHLIIELLPRSDVEHL